MLSFWRKTDMPKSPTSALPGRSEPIPTAASHFVNAHPLKGPHLPGPERAFFGLVCFWGAERKFWEFGDGVFVNAAGYAGFTPNPTYAEVFSGSVVPKSMRTTP